MCGAFPLWHFARRYLRSASVLGGVRLAQSYSVGWLGVPVRRVGEVDRRMLYVLELL